MKPKKTNIAISISLALILIPIVSMSYKSNSHNESDSLKEIDIAMKKTDAESENKIIENMQDGIIPCTDGEIECNKLEAEKEFEILSKRIEMVRKNEIEKSKRTVGNNAIPNHQYFEGNALENYDYYSNNVISIIDMPTVDIKKSVFSNFMDEKYKLTNNDYADSSFKPVNYMVYNTNNHYGTDNLLSVISKSEGLKVNIKVPILYDHPEGNTFNEFKNCEIKSLSQIKCDNGFIHKDHYGVYHIDTSKWPMYMIYMIVDKEGFALLYDENKKNGELPKSKAFTSWK